MKNTDLNLIPVFVAIFEERSLSRSANRLQITQPAVSKALKRLREIYNDPLFQRDANGMAPSPKAIDIYPALAAALTNYSSTISQGEVFEPAKSNRVYSFAVLSGIGNAFMPQFFSELRQLAPNINCEVHPTFAKDIEMDLRLQRYDFVIDADHFAPPFIKSEFMFEEQLVVVARKDHPRLKGQLTLEDFLKEEHTAVAGWKIRSSIMSQAQIKELEARKIAYRTSSISECIPIVANTDLIGLCARSIYETAKHQYFIQCFPIPLDISSINIKLYWHPSRDTDIGHVWMRHFLIEQGKRFEDRSICD